jgi:hypothetical protein
MLSFLVLNYNRPKETELCLKSIKQFTKFNHEVVLLNNGGEDHAAIFSFFNQGLIDKLILRKKNSGCGLGTRELFNDFNLDNNYVVYVQCDQFMVRDFTIEELNSYKEALEQNKIAGHVDLAGNQGNGRYSERAHLTSKKFYNSIPNSKGGPGPFANELWTEEAVQNFYKENNLKFFVTKLLFADNGKISIIHTDWMPHIDYKYRASSKKEFHQRYLELLENNYNLIEFEFSKLKKGLEKYTHKQNWINEVIKYISKQ